MNIKLNDNYTITGDLNGRWEKMRDSYIVDMIIDNVNYKGVFLRADDKVESDRDLSPICKFDFDIRDTKEIFNKGTQYGNAYLVGNASVIIDEEMGNVLEVKNENKLRNQNYLNLPEGTFETITHRGFTVCSWVKIDGNTIRYFGNSALFEANAGGYDRYPMTRISCNLFARINSNGVCADATKVHGKLKENTWHHVCYSVNTKEVNVYLDGQAISREIKDMTSCFDNNMLSNMNRVTLGSGEIWGDPDICNARFKNLDIYNSALSGEEINYIYRKEKHEYLNNMNRLPEFNTLNGGMIRNDNNMNFESLPKNNNDINKQLMMKRTEEINPSISVSKPVIETSVDYNNHDMVLNNYDYRNNTNIDAPVVYNQNNNIDEVSSNAVMGNINAFDDRNLPENNNDPVLNQTLNNYNIELNVYNLNNRANNQNTEGLDIKKYNYDEIESNNYQNDYISGEIYTNNYLNENNNTVNTNEYRSEENSNYYLEYNGNNTENNMDNSYYSYENEEDDKYGYNQSNIEPLISGIDTSNGMNGPYVELGQDEVMRGENGNPVINKWLVIDEKVYSTDESGRIRKGWNEYNNKWYHFNYSGQMDTGWLNDEEDNWYYLGEDGIKRIGWLEDANGKLYFLGKDGAMRTGWIKDYDGNWYYFYSNGEMAVNTVVDGYNISWDGACSR